jgi:adenine-specific DNA-methyltransferase
VSSRHALGQWFTPAPVADLALALAVAGRGAPARIVDPTCGDGAMLARAARAVPGATLVGVELDRAAAAAARARLPGARIIDGDVLGGALPLGDADRFDLVIGNPPWVRPDRLPAARRAAMAAALRDDAVGIAAAELEALVGRADLAAACVLRALRLARPGGRVALVLSTALLDAGYARPLWRAVRARAAVRALAWAPAERWFQDAAVNAMIAVLEVGGAPAAVTVYRLTAPTEVAARAVTAGAADGVAELREVADDAPAAWAAALRAPAAWFGVARAAADALVPLGALATIRRGITSGANDVFYLPRHAAARARLEPDVLAPLVHSPRDGADLPIAIDPAATPLVALVIPPGGLATRPAARRWIRAHAAAATRPSQRGRDPWWSLPARPARLFLTKAYGPRFVQRLAPAPMIADQRVYAVEPAPGVDLEALTAALNTTWTALALESLGRASMGHGAVEWTVADAARLPVVDVRRAGPEARAAIGSALAAIAGRPVRHVAVERALADRRALDLAIAAAAPGLAAWLDAAHDALCGSVALRDRWKLPVVQSSSVAARS